MLGILMENSRGMPKFEEKTLISRGFNVRKGKLPEIPGVSL